MENITKRIIQFNKDREWAQFHSPENLVKSINIEAGELLECFQWSGDFNPEDVEEELADVLIYCLQLAAKLDLDPIKIMEKKLIKNGEKYPIETSKGSSKKYEKTKT